MNLIFSGFQKMDIEHYSTQPTKFKQSKFSKGHNSRKNWQFVQKLIRLFTHHPLLADQVSSPYLKYFSRYLADNFRKGENSDKKKNTGQLFLQEESIYGS